MSSPPPADNAKPVPPAGADELRGAREAVSRSEERLTLALSAARMGIYEWTAASGKLEWSDQTALLHGIDPKEFRGTFEHARELTHPEDHPRVMQTIQERTAAGEDFQVEYRVVHPKGQSIHWLYAYGRTLKDDAGVPFRTIGAVLDITEQKSVQDDLRASAETSQTLNQVGQRIAAELDLEKLVQFVTDAATRLTKAHFGAFFYNVISEKGESYTLYTISGVPREAFSNFPMPRNTLVFKPTFEGTGVVRSDDITRDPRYGKSAPYHGMPKGHLPVVSYLAVPVISRTGEVLGGLFFGHPQAGVFGEREEDLVKGLAAQTAVAIDNARLFHRAQQAIQLRDEFLSIASHELRTPLTPLKIQIQSLKRLVQKGNLADITLAHLQNLSASCDRQIARLTALVEELLDVARLNAGKFQLERQTVDLAAVVREAVEHYGDQLSAAGCAVELHAPARLEGNWDPARIERAFVNLLTNAARYAPGKPVTIEVRQQGTDAVISVTDQGIGIAPADHARIFDRYERANMASTAGGLGLGLFITRQIVEAHGGTVGVQSAPGAGATFTITLPIAHEQDA